MPTQEDYELIASLRPGMTVREVALKLQPRGLDGGSQSAPWNILGADGKVTAIHFHFTFPHDVSIHGITMGMNGWDAKRIVPLCANVFFPPPPRQIAAHYFPLEHEGLELLAFSPGQVIGPPADLVPKDYRGGFAYIMMVPFGRLRTFNSELFEKAMASARGNVEEQALAPLRAVENQRKREHMRLLREKLPTLTDPTERFLHWCNNALWWGKPCPALALYGDWLVAGGPDRWHDAADRWNWDQGVEPLRWIVNQPACDAATALNIFYLGEPGDDEGDGEVADLLNFIRRRWAGEGFASNGIGFDLPGYIAKAAPEKNLATMPLSMRRSIPGRTVEKTRYHDGLPVAFWESGDKP